MAEGWIADGRRLPGRRDRLFPKIDVAVAYQRALEVVASNYVRHGIPSVINTSFNVHEEPIVNSPGDAIRAFLQANLDYLAIGNLLVKHPTQLNESQNVSL